MEEKKSLGPENSPAPRFHGPGPSQEEIYNRLFSELKHIPDISVNEQKTKIDICGKNVIEYHEGSRNKPELTLISLFKPTKGRKKGVRFYVFPYILAKHLQTDDESRITTLRPPNAITKQWRKGQHPGDRWINGFFTNEEEVETFLNGIRSLYDKD